jgi:hypothetical protein
METSAVDEHVSSMSRRGIIACSHSDPDIVGDLEVNRPRLAEFRKLRVGRELGDSLQPFAVVASLWHQVHCVVCVKGFALGGACEKRPDNHIGKVPEIDGPAVLKPAGRVLFQDKIAWGT